MKFITFEAYQQLFEDILSKIYTAAPYNQADYFDYVKMNQSRQNRWLKTVLIPDALKTKIEKTALCEWIVITEPWCGDASHLVPLFTLMAQLNPKINLKIALRDSNEELMSRYLTNGTKSIPILVMQNTAGEDKAVWGPRPQSLQNLVVEWKRDNMQLNDLKIALQKWYNADKGRHTFEEFMQLDF